MPKDIRDIWQNACSIIKAELTDISYSTWIKPVEPVSIDANSITLLAPNNFSKGILESKYEQLIWWCRYRQNPSSSGNRSSGNRK